MPAVPGPLLKIVHHYQLSGAQSASFSCWFIEPATTTPANLAATTVALLADYTTNLSAQVTAGIYTDDAFTGISTYLYEVDSATLSAQSAAAPSSPVAGTSTNPMPESTCQVVSLLTANAGRSFRGRVYLPASGYATPSHQAASSQCTSVATAFATYLTAVNNQVAGRQCAIVSITRGVATPVTSVKVGSKMEIQRRRQDKIANLFSSTHAVT